MDLKTLKRIKIGTKSYKISVFNLAILALAVFVYFAFVPKIFGAEKTEFVVKRGDSLRVVAHNLKEAKLIKSKTFFTIYTLVLGRDGSLKAGRYVLSGSQSTNSILFDISGRGGSNDILVTIPEGFNIWEIDQRLSDVGLILPGEIANFVSGEGFLFPDTYRFSRGETPLTILETMSDNFMEKTGILQAEAAKTTRNWRDIVIMASIIEKEARDERDMRLVADVLWKRIDAGIELKVDAVVAYGACLEIRDACDVTKIGVRRAIDELDSRYNTYKSVGLPPTAISNPGAQSIRAAIDPEPNPYWFYLSTPKGEILFSQTGEEHEEKRAIHILGL